MNKIRYLSATAKPASLRLLREFQCNTLEIAPLRRTRHLEQLLLISRSPLPQSPQLPLRYVRRATR